MSPAAPAAGTSPAFSDAASFDSTPGHPIPRNPRLTGHPPGGTSLRDG